MQMQRLFSLIRFSVVVLLVACSGGTATPTPSPPPPPTLTPTLTPGVTLPPPPRTSTPTLLPRRPPTVTPVPPVTPEPGASVLEVTWTVDVSGYGGSGHIDLRGKYQVETRKSPTSSQVGAAPCLGSQPVQIAALKDGEPFCFTLKYIGGGLVKSEWVLSGIGRGVFDDAGFPVSAGSYNQFVPSETIGPDGVVQNRQGGLVEIGLGRGPGFWNGSEEVMGCWFAPYPALTISYTEVRALANLRRRWTNSVSSPEVAPECKSTSTVEIRGTGSAR